jgi:hypothetical protein
MGTWKYKNNDSLLNVPLLSLSRRSKMVPKRYEESTPSPSTRGKVTRSELTSWLGHIVMNTLDIDTIFSSLLTSSFESYCGTAFMSVASARTDLVRFMLLIDARGVWLRVTSDFVL